MHHLVERINVRYKYLISRTNRCHTEHRLLHRWQQELYRAVTMTSSLPNK